MTQRAINGDYIYFVTANVQDRRWFFVTPERASTLGQAIQTCCQIKNFELLAYCILPNHVHLLVRKLSLNEVRTHGQALQRTRGRVRCGSGDGQGRNLFLFSHRRRPRRRCVPDTRYSLSELMHSIKSAFAHTLKQGKVWQHRSNFRIVDSDDYLGNVVEYIKHNYKKMGLAEDYGRSPFIYINAIALGRIFT